MPEDDLVLLERVAEIAAETARGFWNRDNKVWHKGAGDPVSEADIAVDRAVRAELLARRPGYGWLSEETEDDGTRLGRPRVFIVDPIDGTRAFLAGETAWAHSLAVVEAGRPIAAVVYLPERGKLYSASLGGGARLNGSPIRASDRPRADGAELLANRAALDEGHWPGGAPQARRHFRPSLAYRLSLVGEGRFDGMITLRDSWEWDIAAGGLIAEEAGAIVTDRHGAAIRYNNAHPVSQGILAASPSVHADLLSRLTRQRGGSGLIG